MAYEAGAVNQPVEVLPVPSSAYPTPVERPKNSRLDCSKFEQTFGVATGNWEDELATIIGVPIDA